MFIQIKGKSSKTQVKVIISVLMNTLHIFETVN
jgi:hypothetical protein